MAAWKYYINNPQTLSVSWKLFKYYLHLVGGEECGGVLGAPQVPDRQHPVLAPGHQDVGLRGVG